MEQYTPMIRQYLEVKKDYPDAFLFFRLGDFYEMFFDDAIKASRELEITLTGRDGGGETRIPMCGVPHHSSEGYIKTLIQKGYKVAICEQVEDPKEAKGVVRREVTRVITPGTIMDDSMLTSDNNYLSVVVKEDGFYGLAFCDLTTGEFYTPKEDLDSWLAALEEILPFAPKEILLTQTISEEELKNLSAHLQISFSWLEQLMEDHEALAEIEEWFAGKASQLPKVGTLAVGHLLQYLKRTQKRAIGHIREIEIYLPHRHMILDPFTRRNLEITETIRNKGRYGSLLWLMDRTVTPMGGRLLKRWMDKPLVHPRQIEERQDAVQFFLQNPILRAEMRSRLKEVYDLERLAGRLSYGNINGRDMVQIRRSLELLPDLIQLFQQTDGDLPKLIASASKMDSCQDICEKLRVAIVDDPPLTLKEGGLIKEGYHEGLDRLREASRNGKQWIAALEQREREITGIRSLKVGFNKVFGYYIEVTKANLAQLPKGRYERKQTLANAERFVTEELKEKEALILQAEEHMTELEYQLFQEIRQFLLQQIPRLQQVAQQIATIDVFLALAQIAEENYYVRPSIHPAGELHIEGGRHPVIEAVLKKERYIPNSTHLDQQCRIYLITGPNMAGKSTYMRQVALIQIMFQMGSFVPAERAELSVVDRIFTRIGAADDIVEGQSTFMVEMNEIKITTTQATKESLVIIDELGRSTSTQDGIAIAQAVIEYLHHKIGCKTLVSTHFHELASLESNLPKLKNYHMAVKETENDVIFTRQLVAGAASKSYGIYCAHLAGLPTRIIERANQLIAKIEKIEHVEQLDLFSPREHDLPYTSPEERKRPVENLEPQMLKVIERIQSLDIINMTPMQAFQQLYELKKLVEAEVAAK